MLMTGQEDVSAVRAQAQARPAQDRHQGRWHSRLYSSNGVHVAALAALQLIRERCRRRRKAWVPGKVSEFECFGAELQITDVSASWSRKSLGFSQRLWPNTHVPAELQRDIWRQMSSTL